MCGIEERFLELLKASNALCSQWALSLHNVSENEPTLSLPLAPGVISVTHSLQFQDEKQSLLAI